MEKYFLTPKLELILHKEKLFDSRQRPNPNWSEQITVNQTYGFDFVLASRWHSMQNQFGMVGSKCETWKRTFFVSIERSPDGGYAPVPIPGTVYACMFYT